MLDATPTEPTTTSDETIRAIAEGFEAGDPVRLGRYVVTSLGAGWNTQLVFSDVRGGGNYTKVIDTDGPTHAASEVFTWWTTDAWNL